MLHAFVLAAVWFVFSLSIELRSRVAFWFYLDERVGDLNPLLAPLPGYLERRYARWCTDHGEEGSRRIRIRLLLTANAAAAGVCAASLLALLLFK